MNVETEGFISCKKHNWFAGPSDHEFGSAVDYCPFCMKDEIERLSAIESIEKGTAKALLDALKEVETLSTEVSNLKLANGEARKTIDRLNALVPREPNSGGDPISSIQEKDDG